MPPTRTQRNRKPPPSGFDDIEPTLLEFAQKMKDAENESHDGKTRNQSLWPIYQVVHARSRYIYDLYYEKEAISRPLYDYLLKHNYADASLIAKWKKAGYEKLCCLRCITAKETNFGSVCICRVPRARLVKEVDASREDEEDEDGEEKKEEDTRAKQIVEKDIECVNCGCRGCASSD